jgi:hypothetical protein
MVEFPLPRLITGGYALLICLVKNLIHYDPDTAWDALPSIFESVPDKNLNVVQELGNEIFGHVTNDNQKNHGVNHLWLGQSTNDRKLIMLTVMELTGPNGSRC